MSSTARLLQQQQVLYDFKARAVAGNGVETIMKDPAPITSCLSTSSSSPMCSAIQALLLIPCVCSCVGLLLLLLWSSFAIARRFCACCCNNCGGRKPQPAGGKYSRASKIALAVVLFVAGAIIVAISSIAISAAYDAPAAINRFYSAILDFLDQGTSFLNSANGFVLSNGALIANSISGVQTSFSGLQNTLNSSQINANAQLLSMNASLSVINSSCANFSSSSAVYCVAKVASFRSNIASSTSSLNKFQVKSLALNDASSEIAPKLASNTQPTRDAITQGASFTSSTRKSLLNFQLTSEDPQGRAQMGTLLLFGGIWAIPLFFSLAFMCQKWTYWYLPYWVSCFGAFIFWVLLGGLYVVSYILNNTCDLTPTASSPPGPQPLASSIGSSMMQSFFDECVTTGGSRSLFKVVNVSTSALDKQISDFSLAKQVNISYISEYNQTLLTEVKNNQAVFDGLNATSFITSTGVSEGTLALLAIQGIAACGSRTFTVSNVSTCIGYCSGTTEVSNCKKASAYGAISLYSAILSSTNPMVLGNITAMNSTVNAIVPAINVADIQLKSALSSLSTGFSRFNQCGWIGTSFVNIRNSLCGNVADTLNVMWLCCGVLGVILMYLPIFIIKAEKRFKRPHSSSFFPANRTSIKAPPLNSSDHRNSPQSASAPPASLSSSHDFAVAIHPSMTPVHLSSASDEHSDNHGASPIRVSQGRGPLRNPYT